MTAPWGALIDRRPWLALAVAILTVTALRLVSLSLAATDLYVDEAQYWSWAQQPAWGYYSKPPLIAWLIGLSQSVCGTGEACVRTPSTLAWAVTAGAVAGVGSALYGRPIGFWAGLSALLAPGAAYSARIISTDAPLLAFWSLALLAFVRLRAGGGWRWGVLLAAGLGLGLLSKYAMAWFPGCLLLAALADPASRRALARPPVWGGVLAGALMLAPNLTWQAAHGLATLKHTARNASGNGGPGLDDGFAFVAAQFALAGPVIFAAACAAIWLWARGRLTEPEDRLLLVFSAPILLLLIAMAFVTRANANWAATGLVAVFVLGPALLLRWRRRGWLIGGLAFGLIVQIALPLADAHAWNLTVGGRPVFERTLGWRQFGAAVVDRAHAVRADVIVAERRRDASALLYYARDQSLRIAAWPAPDQGPQDHFQMDRPLTAIAARNRVVLAVAACPGAGRFAGWARVSDLGELTAPAGVGAVRQWRLYRLEGPPPVVRSPPPCP
ncbi:ArnT family glycosyltransferase [Brevundimonas sp.]|uniref:ArnT family glycosyltransferase n=1 Tax=Brevundimonas sp. TaxID=1871086 RepID=UPI003564DD97